MVYYGVNIYMPKTNKSNKRKGEQKMAVLTADCDRAFVVSPDKAKEFNSLKANPNLFKQIEYATKKLEKNLKVDIYKK